MDWSNRSFVLMERGQIDNWDLYGRGLNITIFGHDGKKGQIQHDLGFMNMKG